MPSWRDGNAGAALQISMARLLSIRYFDFEVYKEDTNSKGAFSSAKEWVAFGRMHPFVLRCFQERFGSDQTKWDTATATRWGEIMRGDWDSQIHKMSDVFPETFDANPILMVDRAWSPLII